MRYFKTLPKFLAQKGYSSFQGGKWWEFSYPNGRFTHGMSTGWTKEDRKIRIFLFIWWETRAWHGKKNNQPLADFLDTNKENPFSVWWAPDLPHWPFEGRYFYNIYKDKPISESAKKYYANVLGLITPLVTCFILRNIIWWKIRSLFMSMTMVGISTPSWVSLWWDSLACRRASRQGSFLWYDLSHPTHF